MTAASCAEINHRGARDVRAAEGQTHFDFGTGGEDLIVYKNALRTDGRVIAKGDAVEYSLGKVNGRDVAANVIKPDVAEPGDGADIYELSDRLA